MIGHRLSTSIVKAVNLSASRLVSALISICISENLKYLSHQKRERYYLNGCSRMSCKQRNLYETIKRALEEWLLKGNAPCWVVALLGETVIYYNHFESGFNCLKWFQFGIIDHYHSMQSGLEDAVKSQLNMINTGYASGGLVSGPIAGKYADS